MNTSVQGIGWLTKERYGRIRSGLSLAFEAGEGAHSLAKKGVFSHTFKNFGRLDPVSRTTACAVSLALQDAGIEYDPEQKQDFGIIATNAEGSLQADIAYFKDYIAGGRTLSRGNLFIYTLPSSPAGEAAIHFGLRGPLLYVAGGKNAFLQVLETASAMVLEGEAPAMIAGRAEEDEAFFFVISPGRESAFCSAADAGSLVKKYNDVSGLVQAFSALRSKRQ